MVVAPFLYEAQMVIGSEKQCYLQVAFRRACNGAYVRIGSLHNDFRGGAYRDYTQMFIFWTKPGFRYECILAKTHPKRTQNTPKCDYRYCRTCHMLAPNQHIYLHY